MWLVEYVSNYVKIVFKYYINFFSQHHSHTHSYIKLYIQKDFMTNIPQRNKYHSPPLIHKYTHRIIIMTPKKLLSQIELLNYTAQKYAFVTRTSASHTYLYAFINQFLLPTISSPFYCHYIILPWSNVRHKYFVINIFVLTSGPPFLCTHVIINV